MYNFRTKVKRLKYNQKREVISMEKSWFNKTSQEVEQELKTDYQKGLSNSQVQENIKKYGGQFVQISLQKQI